jgi:hypothetical protein
MLPVMATGAPSEVCSKTTVPVTEEFPERTATALQSHELNFRATVIVTFVERTLRMKGCAVLGRPDAAVDCGYATKARATSRTLENKKKRTGDGVR